MAPSPAARASPPRRTASRPANSPARVSRAHSPCRPSETHTHMSTSNGVTTEATHDLSEYDVSGTPSLPRVCGGVAPAVLRTGIAETESARQTIVLGRPAKTTLRTSCHVLQTYPFVCSHARTTARQPQLHAAAAIPTVTRARTWSRVRSVLCAHVHPHAVHSSFAPASASAHSSSSPLVPRQDGAEKKTASLHPTSRVKLTHTLPGTRWAAILPHSRSVVERTLVAELAHVTQLPSSQIRVRHLRAVSTGLTMTIEVDVAVDPSRVTREDAMMQQVSRSRSRSRSSNSGSSSSSSRPDEDNPLHVAGKDIKHINGTYNTEATHLLSRRIAAAAFAATRSLHQVPCDTLHTNATTTAAAAAASAPAEATTVDTSRQGSTTQSETHTANAKKANANHMDASAMQIEPWSSPPPRSVESDSLQVVLRTSPTVRTADGDEDADRAHEDGLFIDPRQGGLLRGEGRRRASSPTPASSSLLLKPVSLRETAARAAPSFWRGIAYSFTHRLSSRVVGSGGSRITLHYEGASCHRPHAQRSLSVASARSRHVMTTPSSTPLFSSFVSSSKLSSPPQQQQPLNLSLSCPLREVTGYMIRSLVADYMHVPAKELQLYSAGRRVGDRDNGATLSWVPDSVLVVTRESQKAERTRRSARAPPHRAPPLVWAAEDAPQTQRVRAMLASTAPLLTSAVSAWTTSRLAASDGERRAGATKRRTCLIRVPSCSVGHLPTPRSTVSDVSGMNGRSSTSIMSMRMSRMRTPQETSMPLTPSRCTQGVDARRRVSSCPPSAGRCAAPVNLFDTRATNSRVTSLCDAKERPALWQRRGGHGGNSMKGEDGSDKMGGTVLVAKATTPRRGAVRDAMYSEVSQRKERQSTLGCDGVASETTEPAEHVHAEPEPEPSRARPSGSRVSGACVRDVPSVSRRSHSPHRCHPLLMMHTQCALSGCRSGSAGQTLLAKPRPVIAKG